MQQGFSRRSFLALAGVAATATGLSACGSAGPGTGPGSPAPAGSATMWGLTGASQDYVDKSVAAWSKAHPDQAIKVDFFANDAFKTKIRTAIGAGQGPTLMWSWGGGVLKSYIDAGQVLDLSSFAAQNPAVQDRYIPSVLTSGVIDGRTYGLPNNNLQPIVLYYNKEIFAKVGATPPTTWDELMSLVGTFKAQGIAPFALGGQSKWPNLMWIEYLLDRIGGPEVFRRIAAKSPGAWSDPAVSEALHRIQQLVDAGGFITGFSSVAADSNADQALLFTGKAAMLLQGSWIYQTLKTGAPDFMKSGKLGYTTFPTVAGGTGDPKNVVGNPSNFWSVSATATEKQRQAALAYLKDGLLTPADVDTMITDGGVPVLRGVEARLAASPDKDFLDLVYGMATAAPNFQLSWDQALGPAQADALLANLDQIFLKSVTPEQFVATMNQTIAT
jgi:raffinose/stachyose/melibiose transport system substrate-binding protein